MTFGELYKIIKTGKAVRTTSYYNNTRTYFINKNGVAVCQFNKCRPSMIYGDMDENDESEVNPLFNVKILPYYNI
jgi:hypothetical protein